MDIWPRDKAFPLTRSTKVDNISLMKEAEAVVADLRVKGGWDAQASYNPILIR